MTPEIWGVDGDRSRTGGKDGAALLMPHVFGEAISSLSRTKVSVSKIKSLWSYFVHDVVKKVRPLILSALPLAYNLNAMLSALKDRGKASAAAKAYQRAATKAEKDEPGSCLALAGRDQSHNYRRASMGQTPPLPPFGSGTRLWCCWRHFAS